MQKRKPTADNSAKHGTNGVDCDVDEFQYIDKHII